MQHTLTSTVPVKASEAGALDGFEVRCSCGFVGKSTVEVNARLDGDAHIEWARRTSTDDDERTADLPFLCRVCAYNENLLIDEYVQATTVQDCDFAEGHTA